jgi:tRNA nucleotidyltransferase/poly(A) polymerase
VRRDFTINAMAQDLMSGQLIDPHRGQQDLADRCLVFLHDESVSDDPTRVIRASRYAARLGFVLAPDAKQQVAATVRRWPWSWHADDSPDQAPPALANRLRMELDRLFAVEPWAVALDCLEEWQAMALLDSSLQHDRRRKSSDCLGATAWTSLAAGLVSRLHRILRRLPVAWVFLVNSSNGLSSSCGCAIGCCLSMYPMSMRPQMSGLPHWRPRAGCQKQWP